MAGPKWNPPRIPDPNYLGGARQESEGTSESKSFLGAGRIIHVDTASMVCSVVGETGTWSRNDVLLPSPAGSGPRSWAGSIPEPGTRVLVGWSKVGSRGFKPQIVQFLTSGTYLSRDYAPFQSVSPDQARIALDADPSLADDPAINLKAIRLKSPKGYPGDYVVSSSSGADSVMDRDVWFTNRAGNEIRLRDSDQSYILQTINEFVSNSAGYYRRGLIKRNAFNFLPDIPVDDKGNVKKDSPAFTTMLKLGLINKDGTKILADDPNNLFYPYDVLSDGQRASFIVRDERNFRFSETNECYVEDRADIRHTSDGVMSVTAEGDGVQIESFAPYIEDVKGTIVGNDPKFPDEYKQVLTMQLFDDAEPGYTTGIIPKYSTADTLEKNTDDTDSRALARLFTIQCPVNSNKYTFGVSKEGRVFLHVPASSGKISPEDKGKSIDLNTAGKVRAVLGADPADSVSLFFNMAGGIKGTIGRMNNDGQGQADGNSIDMTLKGGIFLRYEGNDSNGLARGATVGGSSFDSVSANAFQNVGGSSSELVGGAKTVEATSINENCGPGGRRMKSSGDVFEIVAGKTSRAYALPRISTFALNDTKVVIAGADSETVLVGSKLRTVTAGAGIVDTVGAGNYVVSVGAGSYSISVGAGSFSIAVGAGAISLATAAGAATFASSLTTTIAGGVATVVTAPLVTIGAVPVGGAVSGIPGPPGPHIDYVTGIPIRGSALVLMG
jgi:hypothetical protein